VQYSSAEGVAIKTSRWILGQNQKRSLSQRLSQSGTRCCFSPVYGYVWRFWARKLLERSTVPPILAQLNTLLNDILLIVLNIDILLHEQLPFLERLKKDIEQNPIEREKGRKEKELKGWQLRMDSMAGLNLRNICTT
jgi:hypothetical protein